MIRFFIKQGIRRSIYITFLDVNCLQLSCNTEARQTDDSSVPHDKIIDCITSCVLLARLSDIIKWQKDLLHVYLNSLAPAIPWTGMHLTPCLFHFKGLFVF